MAPRFLPLKVTMSFGFSVGDVIAVAKLASSIRKQFVDAPEQFRAISHEVKGLSNAIRDVEDFLSERKLSGPQERELRDIADGCCDVLEPLKKTLNKYHELDSDPKSFGMRSRRLWKRLKWEPEDIKELRGRIVLNISLLNAFNGQLIRQVSTETKEYVDRLHKHQEDRESRQEHQAIVDWLTPIDFAPQQSDFIARRQEGTGQWLLGSNEFQIWLKQSKRTMFCPGMPGAGKTIIASIVVDHVYTTFQNDASIGVAYLYCNFRRHQEQKDVYLLANLLKQLVQEQPSMPKEVKSLYNSHKDKRTYPSFREISKVLQPVAANYSRCFIIIDALDECQFSDGSRRRLLSELFNLRDNTSVSLFITSRFILEIEKEFKGSISLEIRASQDDVQRYINGKMSLLRPFVSKNPTLQAEIKTEIVKAADGMFLLAQLHMDSLIAKTTPKAIRLALKRLQRESKAAYDDEKSQALDSAYKQAMERIESQEGDFQVLAKRVLSWITCAKRPLTILELQHALAIEVGESELDEENLLEIEDMVSVCAGLVTIDDETSIIRLVHYTTQEYFERTWINWFPNAEIDITETCVTYLLFTTFETGFCPTDEDFEVRLQLNPLYSYAAQNWGHHARTALTEVEVLIFRFLESEARVSATIQAIMARYTYSGYSQEAPRQTTGAHLIAYFGLQEAMSTFIKYGHDPNLKDSRGWTALSWAAVYGHEDVIKLLLANDSTNTNPKDVRGNVPLSLAAGKGHEAVVKLLLANNSVDANSTDNIKRTPLWWAVVNRHTSVVKLLLANASVDANSKDNIGATPLQWAAGVGHEAVVALLLAKDGVDADSKDMNGQTPLLWAARKWAGGKRGPLWNGNEHEAVVKLLLANDSVDVNSKDNIGASPLLWAAGDGYDGVVKLFLEKDGIDANSANNHNQTPLQWAARGGHEAVVKLLLANDGVDADSKNSNGQTPLSWAALRGRESVVRLLLAKDGVNANSMDNDGRTALSWAIANGHEAVVKLLRSSDNRSL
ncbi:hypothetical protein V499_09532 [Pseudogymnoascus sp. VKM F-103]|nr:hypothetical protein V499_09532 [Pseudogymnoascus sp. VKM F-103]